MFFVELIKILAWVLLSIIELAMLIRAIMSWFVMGDNPFVNILNTITEPFIFPFRRLFEKMNWFQNFPIDIPALIAFLIVSFLTMVLTP